MREPPENNVYVIWTILETMYKLCAYTKNHNDMFSPICGSAEEVTIIESGIWKYMKVYKA